MTTLMWQFWIELNPATAAKIGVIEGDLITVKSPHGSITGPAFPFPGIRPDVVAVPVGYGHTKYGKLADGVGANAMDLLGTTTDEASGALAFRSQKVSISKAGGSVVMMRNANPRGEYKGEIFQL
jgi:molybdopterin-containing oxidoreductase family iron-sulfur binding subunit